jgi:hypothetical protein
VRFARATAEFAGTSTQAIVIGGFHVGGDVRVLF